MPGTLDEIVIKIGADIKGATAGIARVEAGIKGMDASVGSAAANIRSATGKMVKAFAAVGAAAAVGLAVGVGKATMTFADFEQAVTNAASVTGQSGAQYEATKANIEALSKTLGETTVFSARQAASAMYDLASAGYDVGTMTKTDLKPIMDLAAATQADLTFATETVTSTLGQFVLGIEDSSRVSDVFAKTIGSSKATIDKLGLSLKYVGPVAKSLGMDIEDVSAMLGQLYNAGFKGEQAGTALRSAMSRLMNPTAAVNDILQDMGLTYDEVNPATNDFADTLTLLQDRGMDANAAMKLFGVEAAPAMLSLMDNTAGIHELEAALREAAGAAGDMAGKQLDTLRGSLTLLKSAFEGLMIAAGEMAAPAVRDFATKITEAIPRIKELATAGFGKLKTVIKELTPTWTNLKTIFSSSVGIITDIFGAFSNGSGDTTTLTDAINTLTGALAKVFRWIDRHPTITRLAVTVGTAAAAFSYLLPAVTAIGTAAGFLITALSTAGAVMAGTTTATAVIGAAIAAIGGPITLIVGAIALLGAAWATNLFGIRDKTTAVVAVLRDAFTDLVNWIGPKLETVFNTFATVYNKMVPVLNKAGFDLEEISKVHFEAIGRTASQAAENITASSTNSMLPVSTTIAGANAGSAPGQELSRAAQSLTVEPLSITSPIIAEISRSAAAQATQAAQLNIHSILSQSLTVQQSSNSKLDMLTELTDISAKLDTLKIEVNNYITNVSRSSGGSNVKESLSGTQSGA